MTDFTSINDKLSAIFKKEGFKYVELPLLYKSETFSSLVGSDINRRLFRTKDADGTELCMRPDFTIPISMYYLDSGKPGRKEDYCYSGPIFRQRLDEIGEFQQTGAEIIGKDNKESADARIFGLALKTVKELGINNPAIKIGDETIFSEVVKAFDLPLVWQRRFRDRFGDSSNLERAISRMTELSNKSGSNYLKVFEKSNPDDAIALVEHILALGGNSVVGGRTAREIAERYIEQAKLSYNSTVDAEKSVLLAKFLSIRASADKAVSSLRNFEKEAKISLKKSIDVFQKRLDLISKSDIDVGKLNFSADFGRGQKYYSGFTFEFYNQKTAGSLPIAGGGRYDKLFQLIGVKSEIPAVGFTLWLERVV